MRAVATATEAKPKKPLKKSKWWRRLRQAVQVLALLLFLYLLLGAHQRDSLLLPDDLFFRLDPLAGISAMLASRRWIAPMALGGVTLLLTLAVGRAWCGWICPLGTLVDWMPARHPRRKGSDIPSYWRQGKYFLFFVILLAAALGSMTLLVLDPIALVFQTLGSVLLPGLSSRIAALEEWLYDFEALQPTVEWVDGHIRDSPVAEQNFFLPSLLIALAFAVILALNAIRPVSGAATCARWEASWDWWPTSLRFATTWTRRSASPASYVSGIARQVLLTRSGDSLPALANALPASIAWTFAQGELSLFAGRGVSSQARPKIRRGGNS
jgi:hypothetical protein